MSNSPMDDKISNLINKDDVVLFMKGNPVFPQCGFSATVIDILSNVGVAFQSYNVLEDDALRDGIKKFSNWPTIPQLYVKGEFVGGCDIVKEMFAEGELDELFKSKNIKIDD